MPVACTVRCDPLAEECQELAAAGVNGQHKGEARRHVRWLCRECAHQRGSHTRSTAAMVKRGDFLRLVSSLDTPYERSYTVLPRH